MVQPRCIDNQCNALTCDDGEGSDISTTLPKGTSAGFANSLRCMHVSFFKTANSR
jgi:hypothetical protein